MRVLRTGDLALEPQVAAHAEEMFEVLSDPALYEYENGPPASLNWLRTRFGKLESRRSADGSERWLNWVIRLPSSGLAGYVQATVYGDGRAAIAYVLGSRHWGQGLASRAVRAMLEELVARYGVRTFTAELKRENHRSMRLLERLGFMAAPLDLAARVPVEPDEVLLFREAIPMNAILQSLTDEYRRYRALAEAALEQVPETALSEPGPAGGNSLAVICWHVSGNLRSRFTDFLTSDGEKPWRGREEEFAARTVSRAELAAKWNQGWDVLLGTLASLTDADLAKTIRIRDEPFTVHAALHRSLAHTSYHVGQIVTLAHAIRGGEWRYLSIPPGGTDSYNANPTHETPAKHAERLREIT
jgi:ribosomal-protein-alanine N-acetyltransferase